MRDGERLEAFLARLYTDDQTRAAFERDARGEATKAGLGGAELERIVAIDRAGLTLFATSLKRKRGA